MLAAHTAVQMGGVLRGFPFFEAYPKNLFGLFLTSKGHFNFSGYLK